VAKSVLLNRMVVIGGHRISRDANRAILNIGRTKEDAKVLEDKSDRYELGSWQGDFELSGHTTEDVEARFLAEIAKATVPSTPVVIFLANGNGNPGQDAVQMDACAFEFSAGGDHGKISPFTLAGAPHDRGTIGQILESSIGSVGITGAQNGTALELGAISATQKIVVTYHVLNFPAVEGTTPTIDAKIQSATDEAFTTPVDRIVLPQRNATPIGSVHELAGAVTDTWWRFIVTAVGGTDDPTFWVVVTAAIITA
jgi:hypothetical protein